MVFSAPGLSKAPKTWIVYRCTLGQCPLQRRQTSCCSPQIADFPRRNSASLEEMVPLRGTNPLFLLVFPCPSVFYPP